MSLCWENCRIILCLFRRYENFKFYIQSALINSFYLANELYTRKMHARWKIRVYIDSDLCTSDEYLNELKLLSKLEVEIAEIKLPYENSSKYWFTSLRFILPAQDSNLDAFRLLDCHYLWSKSDIANAINAIENSKEDTTDLSALRVPEPAISSNLKKFLV